MAETIIVGVTEAAESRRAIDWAAARAVALGQRLSLVAVVGGAVGAVGEDEIVDSAVVAARAFVDAEAARVAVPGLHVETRVTPGDPVALLVDASEGASLLVIGGEPRGRGRRGQHGTRIAAGAHSPVVIVPALDDVPRSGVVVGVDGSGSSDHALDFAAAEAARLGEPLIVVSAWTPVAVPGDFGIYPDLYLSNLEQIAASTVDDVVARVQEAHPGLEVLPRVEQGDPSTTINEAAAGASLAVVGSHGRGAFARFLLGSVSEDVLSHLVTATAVVR